VHRGLIALALLTGAIIPVSSALGAPSHRLLADPGSIGIRIVDTPSDRRSDPLALSYIVNQVAPGKTIRRRIEISNSTPSISNVAVYPAAASLRRTGFSFASGHARNEISKWTSVSRTVLRLPPGAKAFETVTIHVPKDASSGERYAVIWAEVSARGSSQRGVTLANRVGIRMYLSVGPGGAPPTNFVIVSLAATRSASGQPLVVARIQNKGRRTIAITGSLTLSDGPGGVRAGPFPVKLGVPLGPGASKSAPVLLDKRLPLGPWRARVQLRARSIQRVAVATITFPRRG
jgi:hypothetical protein